MSSLASFDALIRARRSSRVASTGPLSQPPADWPGLHAQMARAYEVAEPPRLSEWRDPWHCRVAFHTSRAGGQP